MKKRLVIPSLNEGDYDSFADEDLVKALNQVESVPNLSRIDSSHSPNKKKKINWGIKKKVSTSPVYNSNNVDYLKDQRVKRELEGYRPKIIDEKVWDKYLKDQTLSEYQRLEEIRKRTQQVEERARMDEKLVRNISKDQNITKTVEKTIAVNDMYLEAIQAKLKILDQI